MNKNNKATFTVKKILDEGTASPFPARLMLQMFEFRDAVFNIDKEKSDFDKAYKPIIENFQELNSSIKKLRLLRENHIRDLHSGIVIKNRSDNQIDIEKTIDSEYKSGVKDVFIKGEMTISGLKKVGEFFGVNINFFFGKEKKFNDGSQELLQTHKNNAKFIIDKIKLARETWYSDFNEYRNAFEHDYVNFQEVEYKRSVNGNFEAIFPKISDGSDLLDVLEKIRDRILELVEDSLMFLFSTKLKPFQVIRVIPENERNPNIVKKYAIYVQVENQFVRYGNT
jgi:hypothetical protein